MVLLEESVCGRGPSGRNGGFCHGYWSHLPRLRERFGDEGARAVARAGAAIIPGVRAFCEANGVDAWLRESGMLRVSAAPAQDHAVDEEVEAARELGVPEEAVALSTDELVGADPIAGLPARRLPARWRDRPARAVSCSGCGRPRSARCACTSRRA